MVAVPILVGLIVTNVVPVVHMCAVVEEYLDGTTLPSQALKMQVIIKLQQHLLHQLTYNSLATTMETKRNLDSHSTLLSPLSLQP